MANDAISSDVGPNHKMVLKAGKFDKTTRENLREAFRTYRTTARGKPLVLHFHGGLVDEASAEAMAWRLMPEYSRAGGFPLFVIWQTGMIETIRNNWKRIVGADAFQGVLERVLQFTIGRQRSTSGTRAGSLSVPDADVIQDELKRLDANEEPFSGENFSSREDNLDLLDEKLTTAEWGQLDTMVQEDDRLQRAAGRIARGQDELEEEMLAPEMQQEVEKVKKAETTGQRSTLALSAMLVIAVKAIAGTLGRFRRRRDHGLYSTAAEETAKALTGDWLGRTIWDQMKANARDAFGPSPEEFGGTALLQEIAALRQETGDGSPPRVILVGHSAGSIFICEALQAAQAQNLDPSVRFDVVFLAPACTFRMLDQTLKVAGHRIGWFRCFAMLDEHEQADRMLDKFYPRSLLYFVSGAVESESDEPIVGMMRYHSGAAPFHAEAYPEIAGTLTALRSHQNGWIWSITDAAEVGLASRSIKHGDFDDDETTIESIKHIIKGESLESMMVNRLPSLRATDDAAPHVPGKPPPGPQDDAPKSETSVTAPEQHPATAASKWAGEEANA